MRRLIPAFFVIVAMVLLVVFLSKKTSSSTEDYSEHTEIPFYTSQDDGFLDSESAIGIEDNSLVSFMTLRPDETLLSSTGIDLDGDNLDDEIIVVRKAGVPFLYLVIGLYNSSTTVYDRIAEIRTEVTQLKSFSYNAMDITGDHRTALVYQGFTDDGNSVLQMYFCRRSGLVNIGSFKSDGTIFIQQHNRSETYELSQSSDKSFPVWTYASDTREGASSLSQVQTEYDWDSEAGRYVQTRQVFVTGKNIAAAELAKIQDGTIETFANYLNGLWYKTDNEDDEVRYIFFDYAAREIIFLVGDSQEVYNWQNSNLYRNGVYLSTVNMSIENLRRRFDLSLTGVDEMRVNVYDDVRMRINADALWNGQYRKMNMKKDFNEVEEIPADLVAMRARIEEVGQWSAPDGAMVVFKNGTYFVDGESSNENGIYFVSKIEPNFVLQFNTNSKERYLAESYIIAYGENENSLVLHPAKILSNTVYEITGRIITLSAVE